MDKKFRGLLIVLLGIMLLSGTVFASADADKALDSLMKGNERFIAGKPAAKEVGDVARKELVKGQHPIATILTCSDSRVPPEHIFDKGLGEIFVIRTAGNITDKVCLGTIEYGVEHLHTPVFMIMGHSNCGAVKATIEATAHEEKAGHAEGNIGTLIETIKPAVEKAKKEDPKHEHLADKSIEENVKLVYQTILAKSPVVKKLAAEKKIKIVLAVYSLETGKVTIIGEPEVK
ncbi:MAG: carbonic anhydrase [Firmicutes bacterium]|nr:carbonic anhydrase [Bacillota bacterium]